MLEEISFFINCKPKVFCDLTSKNPSQMNFVKSDLCKSENAGTYIKFKILGNSFAYQ